MRPLFVMLKHPDLSLRRVQQLTNSLKLRLYGERAPLKVEVNERCCKDQNDALKGPWRKVEPGYRWGPAYATRWFRIAGDIPRSFRGKEVKALLDLGGERTLWRDNSPIAGMDVEHADFGLLGGSAISVGPAATAGKRIELMVEAYARNPQATVHGKEPPREALVETFQRAELAVFDRPLQELVWDLEFALSLLSALPENEPAHANLLRALNDCANVFATSDPDAVNRCRKRIANALGELGHPARHSLTAVGHAHLDTAWLWPLATTRQKMAHTTATQLALIERYPWYVYVHSQASQYEWLEREYPTLFKRVKAAVKTGRWEPVGSMWVEADCNLSGGESLVRQFMYGRAYFREKLGYETDDMWLPDVFGYSAALPQILNKFGIKYFLTQKISWNQFNKFPHHTFWWQGIDGSKVWAHFPPADTYCGSCEPKEVLASVRNYRDHARADQSLYLFGFGDGGGGPTERHLELLERGRNASHYPELHLGNTAKQFFRDALDHSDDLATWSGELYLELHRGTYTSQAANKRDNRKSEFLLRDAEWLASFAYDRKNYPIDELEAAWKLVLLNQFHDIIPGSSVREVYEDSAGDYAAVFAAGERIIQDCLKRLAGKMHTGRLQAPLALFHNATVPSQASIPWPKKDSPTAILFGDETLPVQLVDEWDGRKLIFATPSAALGAVAVGDLSRDALAQAGRLKASARSIENHEWSVRFDANGNITSVRAMEDGSEFIEPGKLANVFQLLDDKPLFWSAWDVDLFSHETAQDLARCQSFEVVERGPVRVAVEWLRRFGNSTARQRISLGPTPGIRFDTEIDWQEEDKMLKVAFPLNVNTNRATFEIQFGSVERPNHMNTTWDMARFEVCAQKWVDMSEGDQGVALLNDGKYGHDVLGNVLRLTLLRSPRAPDPTCDVGLHRFSYVLLPHFGAHHYGGVVQAAYAFNSPVRYAFLDKHNGKDSTSQPFVVCDDRNIVVETVKRAEDGDGLIVRMYECHNSRGRASLYCMRSPKQAMTCNLEEVDQTELDITEGGIQFQYRPFEIITIRLRGI